MVKKIALAALIAIGCATSLPALAQASATQQYVVTYVETIPAQDAAAQRVLQNYVQFASHQAGVIKFDLEKDIGFTNRYAIRQVWRSAADYNAFLNASQGWTGYLAPFLDAPFDNRLGNFVD